MIAGLILAATGAAPEHWFAELVHGAHLPAEALHLWSAGIDPRLVLVFAGFCLIAGEILWRQVRPRAVALAPPPDTGALPLPARHAMLSPQNTSPKFWRVLHKITLPCASSTSRLAPKLAMTTPGCSGPRSVSSSSEVARDAVRAAERVRRC